jgi:PKD repeat protein
MTTSTPYPSSGPRTVTLTVTDAEGLTGTQTQTITVGSTQPPTDAPPVARFTWSCPTLRCYFDASGSTDDVGIVSYAWTWGKEQYNKGAA